MNKLNFASRKFSSVKNVPDLYLNIHSYSLISTFSSLFSPTNLKRSENTSTTLDFNLGKASSSPSHRDWPLLNRKQDRKIYSNGKYNQISRVNSIIEPISTSCSVPLTTVRSFTTSISNLRIAPSSTKRSRSLSDEENPTNYLSEKTLDVKSENAEKHHQDEATKAFFKRPLRRYLINFCASLVLTPIIYSLYSFVLFTSISWLYWGQKSPFNNQTTVWNFENEQ
eukprot:Awhi_evm1s14073